LNASGVVDLIRQPRAQALHDPQPLGGGTILLPIPYYMTLYKGYIQMTFFPETPKWESQNWYSCCIETLDIHIFFKSNMFGACKGNIL